MFADDTQSYSYYQISETPLLVARLSSCIDYLAKSYASLRLQLNPSKTEFIWFGSHTNLLKIPSSSRPLQVCDSLVDYSEVVRDLGVFFDSEMSMKHHISKTASTCFYHIRRLRQIRHLVSREVLTQLATSLVLSRLDYCNAVLAGLPASTLAPLQLFNMHRTRPPVSRSGLIGGHTSLQRSRNYIGCRSSTVSPSKLLLSCIRLSTVELIVFASADSNVHQLRYSTTRAAAIKRSRTQFGRRAFSVAGPDIWNSLPATIRNIDSHPVFHRAFKTHLFRLAFDY